MKKTLTLALSFFVLVACVFISACAKSPIRADDTTVFITATDESYDFADKKLADYMNYLKDKGELTFEIDNGMVTMVNGKYQTSSSFWMLYTDDAENSNNAWGTFEHEGKIYGSATLGVTELVLKEGCVYVLTYQSFSL